ncbi:hypothetical protein DENSPDRAFT_930439 [Dentipellis sp. KUC8613]|nr:hypothetical protein DENSPDRAFT_930439 [Dentipellis sp. KUC8613]
MFFRLSAVMLVLATLSASVVASPNHGLTTREDVLKHREADCIFGILETDGTACCCGSGLCTTC